jgi:hypothetical protein
MRGERKSIRTFGGSFNRYKGDFAAEEKDKTEL